jgi:stress response protein YsnF
MGDTPPDPNTTIELAEEVISVGKRRVETGRVRVRIRTESRETQASGILFDQDVDIRRVPIGRDVTEVPAVRQEGDVTIYPVLEEVLVVEKRLVLKEEVHVRCVITQTEVSQPVTLRRQWADVERTAEDNADPSKE